MMAGRFNPKSARLNSGARRDDHAASQNAAGIPSPINVPSSRRLKSLCPSPAVVQPLTSSGIRSGNESFDISLNEWRLARLTRLTSSRQRSEEQTSELQSLRH